MASPGSGSFEVKGLKELNKTLNKLPRRIAQRSLINALRAHGKIIVQYAQAFVPEDTGALKKAIGQKAAKRQPKFARYMLIGVVSDVKEGGLAAATYANAIRSGLNRASARRAVKNKTGLVGFENSPYYYWRFVEFGTSKRKARPFIVPATQSALRLGPPAFRKKLKENIEKEIAKLDTAPKYYR